MKRGMIFISGVLLLACAPALYRPSQETANRAGVSLEELQRGRQLYVEHCGSCHHLHLPHEYPELKWKMELDTMTSRARITKEEEELIFKFIKAGM